MCQPWIWISDDEGDLLFLWETRDQDSWERKQEENEVCDDVEAGHGEEIGVPASTLRSGVWSHLPVIGERLTSGEVADNYREEGDDEESVQTAHEDLVGVLPEWFREAPDEHEGAILDRPQTSLKLVFGVKIGRNGNLPCSVHNSRNQNKLASNFSSLYILQ
jgi:hypothetical protein